MTRARDVADTQDNTGGAVAPFVAGKNKIINGDCFVAQRGTSTNLGFARNASPVDKFYTNSDSSLSGTMTQQAFTPGAGIPGYEFAYFLRTNITAVSGGTFANMFSHDVEDVRTLAGQVATYSFWAKAAVAGTYTLFTAQFFGTGGSSPGFATQTFNVTTSWQRFTFTQTLGSMSGKTIGPGSSLQFFIRPPGGLSTCTLDAVGFQLEAGPVATPFTTATGNPASELAACQRYYYRLDSATASDNYAVFATGYCANSTINYGYMKFPVSMRISPSTSFSTTAANFGVFTGASTVTASNGTFAVRTTLDTAFIRVDTAGGMTAGVGCMIIANNIKTPFIEFSAEL